MFMMDVRPLQAMTDQVRAADLHVFDVRPVTLNWRVAREIEPFPPRGRARIHFWLKQEQKVTISVANAEEQTIRTLQLKGLAGLNDAVWDLRNDKGRELPPGVYRITVSASGRTVSTSVSLRPAM